jgi:hypothetical protein
MKVEGQRLFWTGAGFILVGFGSLIYIAYKDYSAHENLVIPIGFVAIGLLLSAIGKEVRNFKRERKPRKKRK